MRKLTLAIAMIAFTLPAGVQARDADSDALMKEVRAMRGEIKDLKNTIDQMQVLINALAARELENDADMAVLINNDAGCESRIIELERKLDQFVTLGYRDGHPDVKGVKIQIEKLEAECPAKEG